MKLIVATKNKGKVSEIGNILEGLDVELLSLSDFSDIVMPEETGTTFEENALIKASAIASATGFAALADDSGLEVDSLGGRPGVFSARYAGTDATDEENYLKLLGELEGVPEAERTARFRCAVAFVSSDGTSVVFHGTLEGRIAQRPSGTGGFGYDPVFYIPSEGRTSAELSPEEKNRISHRAKALEGFKAYLLAAGGR